MYCVFCCWDCFESCRWLCVFDICLRCMTSRLLYIFLRFWDCWDWSGLFSCALSCFVLWLLRFWDFWDYRDCLWFLRLVEMFACVCVWDGVVRCDDVCDAWGCSSLLGLLVLLSLRCLEMCEMFEMLEIAWDVWDALLYMCAIVLYCCFVDWLFVCLGCVCWDVW